MCIDAAAAEIYDEKKTMLYSISTFQQAKKKRSHPLFIPFLLTHVVPTTAGKH